MPALQPERWTADDVRALPDASGMRFEVVDGELLMSPGPRPSHQRAVVQLIGRLLAYLGEQPVGEVSAGPGEVMLDEYSLVQPDVFVLPLVHGRVVRDDDRTVAPLLVIEVLSPATARVDRIVKRQRYQRAGLEYWIVDLDARLVERWQADADRPEIVTGVLVWHPSGASAPLRVDVAGLMAAVHGDS